MNINMLIFYVMISIFAIVLIAVEFFIFKFIVSLLKLEEKYHKPKQILTLIIVELIAVLTSINVMTKTPIVFALMCLFLAIKVFGLWNTKKWVLYFYVLSNCVSWYISSTAAKGKDVSTLIVAGIIGSALILGFYYVQVYLPNRKEFV
ncbi:MAG: hypothetical protein NTV98_03465 [Candidatus Roizmanbacteria bacterium]|nr:hypothetical protein [Candidatus Roizmanbacteria bacterium]